MIRDHLQARARDASAISNRRAPQLVNFPYDHDIWRLLILGFEGDRVLILKNVDPQDPDVVTLFVTQLLQNSLI